MARNVVGFALWTMVCPITNSLFEEPIVADDGHTYSKSAMIDWIASCKARGLPITSPFTREEISERLVPNANMVTAILEYRAARERAANARRAGGADDAGIEDAPEDAPVGAESLEPVKSLAELGRMFSLMACVGFSPKRLMDGNPRPLWLWERRALVRALC